MKGEVMDTEQRRVTVYSIRNTIDTGKIETFKEAIARGEKPTYVTVKRKGRIPWNLELGEFFFSLEEARLAAEANRLKVLIYLKHKASKLEIMKF